MARKVEMHAAPQLGHHLPVSLFHRVALQACAGKDFCVVHVVLAHKAPRFSRVHVLCPEGAVDEIVTFHRDIKKLKAGIVF